MIQKQAGKSDCCYLLVIVTTAPLHVVTDFNIDDQWPDLSRWCKDLDRIWSSPDDAQWTIDLSQCQYLGPSAAAILYSTWFRARQRGQVPTVVPPRGPEQLVAFWTFSNLSHYLHRGRQADPHDPRNETVPLQQFYENAYQQTHRVVSLVERHYRLSLEDNHTLGSAIHEVCQNIEDHAESPFGGVSCARFFSGKREVRVAVVDAGMTIRASLSKNHAIDSPARALDLVTRGLYTSGSHRHNRGLGISNLIMFVRRMNGSLVLISGSATAVVHPGSEETRIVSLDWSFPGTGVFFTLELSADDPPEVDCG
jgi:anti-sigma regulatory factor (Ser/Thr protein kinase)